MTLTSGIKESQTQRARALHRKLDSIRRDLAKIPSYNGKAAFMDKVIRAQEQAHDLTFSLKVGEERMPL